MTRLDRTPAADRPPRRRRRLLLLLPLLLLLVWWLWPDGRLAKARELRQELFADAGKTLTPEQRREKFQALRTVTRQMSEAQRRELGQEMMKRRQAELERYRQLSPAEKKRQLDADIKRQEEMRKRMQAAASGGRPAPGPSGLGGGPPGGGPRPGRPTTPEERERRRQQMLDHTTPEYRELRDQYRRDLEARRKERGLPPPPSFGGRPR